MAVNIPTFTTTNSAGVFGTVVTITVPAGTVDDDLLYAIIGKRSGTTPTITTPTGWTLVTQQGDGTGHKVLYLFSKVASSEPSSYSWTIDSSQYQGCMMRVTGGEITNPVPVFNSGSSGISVIALDYAETITPASSSNMLVVAMYTSRNGGGLTDITGFSIDNDNPSWTKLTDVNEGSISVSFTIAYATRPQTTATGHFKANQNGSTPGEGGASIAFSIYRSTSITVQENQSQSENITAISARNIAISETQSQSEKITTTPAKIWTPKNKPGLGTWTDKLK